MLDPSTTGVGSPAAGAHVHRDGVTYRVWAPGHKSLAVVVEADGESRQFGLSPSDGGFWTAIDARGKAGDRYQFLLSNGRLRPDPASRFQPSGVHGPSCCIDPFNFQWRCGNWKRPSWKGQSIYEIHIGTFTPAGTYFAAIEKLNHIRELGVEAIELMPLADFAGERNWGYDGVALYAPARCYGHPDELRALVDAAHERGLAVILDVVYNHLGPAGNYLADFSPHYFRTDEATPWGQGFDLDGPHSRTVREFIVGNAGYWLDEFRFDGLRLDATHAISDKSSQHVIEDIAAAVHARGGFVIAEDERNESRLVRSSLQGGSELDALWADDFHHQVRVALTGTRDSYFRAYRGTAADIADTIMHGWCFRGQPYEPWKGKIRGSATDDLKPAAFVYCIENHDQVGNRAKGERLEHLVTPAQFRAAAMLLCLCPSPPLLFMGQEWAASSPFLFFTDHGGELGVQVSVGRKKEFEQLGAVWPEGDFPDPEDRATFAKSKLNWDELIDHPHNFTLAFYRSCLTQRRKLTASAPLEREQYQTASFGEFILVRYHVDHRHLLLVVALRKTNFPTANPPEIFNAPTGMRWRRILASEDATFGGLTRKTKTNLPWKFNGPGGVWLEAVVAEEPNDASA